MKVFLAGIIQGSLVEATIHSQDWREVVKGSLAKHVAGADIYCHYTRHPQSISYDLPAIRETFEDGVRKAAECDLLLAYLPSASMGTAIEMHEAKRAGAAVVTITRMAANWVVRLYSDVILPDAAALEAWLASGELVKLLARSKERQG